jgi:hypothetical protein
MATRVHNEFSHFLIIGLHRNLQRRTGVVEEIDEETFKFISKIFVGEEKTLRKQKLFCGKLNLCSTRH